MTCDGHRDPAREPRQPEELARHVLVEGIEDQVLMIDPEADVPRRQEIVRIRGQRLEARLGEEMPDLALAEAVLEEAELHAAAPREVDGPLARAAPGVDAETLPREVSEQDVVDHLLLALGGAGVGRLLEPPRHLAPLDRRERGEHVDGVAHPRWFRTRAGWRR